MGTSKKAGQAKGRSAKPRNLARRELNARQADVVRGGKSTPQDLNIVKVVDKPSTKFY